MFQQKGNNSLLNLKISKMKNLNETRLAAIQVINKIVVLKTNVANMCPTSREELAIELPRLESIKKWATENDQLQDIKHYLISKTWGQTYQFAAREVSKLFNN